MSYLLKKITTPTFEKEKTGQLYFRFNQSGQYTPFNSIVRNDSISLRSNTFFNIFDLKSWRENTVIDRINLDLTLQGSGKVKVFQSSINRNSEKVHRDLVVEVDFNFSEKGTIQVLSKFNINNNYEKLYFEVSSNSESFKFLEATYTTDIPPQTRPKLGCVICTFRREAYVENNAKNFQEFIDKEDYNDKAKLFIIDNGQTLDKEKLESYPSISVFKNRNTGGSGGFTRGAIEVSKDPSFTHVIFMDDDIIFDPEIFQNTFNFLSYSSKDIMLGASMLIKDKALTTQFARGFITLSEFTPNDIPIGYKLDCTKEHNLFHTNSLDKITGQGWWYYCFPTEAIKEFGLPYPFFIKMDDVEYPNRLKQKYKLIIPDGFAVWHESFIEKYSPTPMYFRYRNRWILLALEGKSLRLLTFIKKIYKLIIVEIFRSRYEHAETYLKAISDFIKGPKIIGHFSETKMQEINKEIKIEKSNYFLTALAQDEDKVVYHENKIRKFFRILTLNGHLLPSCETVNIFNNHNETTRTVYRFKEINYLLTSEKGYSVTKSTSRAFKILVHLIILTPKVIINYSRANKKFKSTKKGFTGINFWKDYLEI